MGTGTGIGRVRGRIQPLVEIGRRRERHRGADGVLRLALGMRLRVGSRIAGLVAIAAIVVLALAALSGVSWWVGRDLRQGRNRGGGKQAANQKFVHHPYPPKEK